MTSVLSKPYPPFITVEKNEKKGIHAFTYGPFIFDRVPFSVLYPDGSETEVLSVHGRNHGEQTFVDEEAIPRLLEYCEAHGSKSQ